jgi:hypothetical protein
VWGWEPPYLHRPLASHTLRYISYVRSWAARASACIIGSAPSPHMPLPGRRLAEAPLIHADGLVWVCKIPHYLIPQLSGKNTNKYDSTGSGTSSWTVSLIISPQARGSASYHVLAAWFQPAVDKSQSCQRTNSLPASGITRSWSATRNP